MLLSSGKLVYLSISRIGVLTDLCSTQESLVEGVKKIREIYKSYDNVGIKDRSMIWNSYVDSNPLGTCPHHLFCIR